MSSIQRWTLTVVCAWPDRGIAETSTVPSVTPLVFTIAATSSVIRMNSWRFFVLNQR